MEYKTKMKLVLIVAGQFVVRAQIVTTEYRMGLKRGLIVERYVEFLALVGSQLLQHHLIHCHAVEER